MNVKGLGKYAKTIAAVAGQAIVYLQLYGTTFHLVPAATMLGVALGVFGIPNAPKPASPAPLGTSSSTTVTPPLPGQPGSFTPPAGSL